MSRPAEPPQQPQPWGPPAGPWQQGSPAQQGGPFPPPNGWPPPNGQAPPLRPDQLYGAQTYGTQPYGQPYPPLPAPQRQPTVGFPKALGAAATWAGVQLALVIILLGPPASAEGFGEVIGRLIGVTLIAALITWAIARRRTWNFWLVLLVATLPYWLLAVAVGLSAR